MRSVYHLRQECELYQLAGREILRDKSNEQLSRWYNGAGPDSWVPEARGILTAAMGLYEPAVLIHDVQFEHSDGSDAGFRQAARDWKANTARILITEYPLFTLRMLDREYRLARAYWHAVKLAADRAISGEAAKRAWLAAYDKHNTNKRKGHNK